MKNYTTRKGDTTSTIIVILSAIIFLGVIASDLYKDKKTTFTSNGSSSSILSGNIRMTSSNNKTKIKVEGYTIIIENGQMSINGTPVVFDDTKIVISGTSTAKPMPIEINEDGTINGNAGDIIVNGDNVTLQISGYVEGDIEGAASIKVDGKVTGNITCNGNVEVGERVTGNITTKGDVTVKGRVTGNINARNINN